MMQCARPEETMRKHARLLIVDDDPDLCDLVQRYLEAEGFVISVVHNGAEGTHAGISGNYDLIVLDVMLPDIKGFDVLRELRARARTPVLMLTAKGDEFERVLGRKFSPFDRSIDLHVSNLRQKLGPQTNGAERIRSVRGIGYLYVWPLCCCVLLE